MKDPACWYFRVGEPGLLGAQSPSVGGRRWTGQERCVFSLVQIRPHMAASQPWSPWGTLCSGQRAKSLPSTPAPLPACQV